MANPISDAEESAERTRSGSTLSPWLQLMLAEISRKREDLEQARAEQLRRAGEAHATPSQPGDP